MVIIGEVSHKDYDKLRSLFGDSKVFDLTKSELAVLKNIMTLRKYNHKNIIACVVIDFQMMEVLENIDFKHLVRHDWMLME